MADQPKSIRDVVDQLGYEFEGRHTVRAVTTVVMRLSENGAMSLPYLADLARIELAVRPDERAESADPA